MPDRATDLVHLHELLVPVLGEEATDTLMNYLPPVRFADLATKDDLTQLETRLGTRIDRLETRIDRLDGRFDGLDGRFDGLEARLVARIEYANAVQIRWLGAIAVAMTGASAAIATAVSAAMGA